MSPVSSPPRPLVRSATLSGYLRLARSLGLDGEQVMRSVGLDPRRLVGHDSWFPAAGVARLLETSAALSGHDDFAILLAERRRFSTLGPISLVLREEPDLRSFLQLLMRYERSLNEAIRLRLEERDEVADVRLWFQFGEPTPADQALALGAAVLHSIVREYVGPHWRPLAVSFGQSTPEQLDVYRRVCGPTVQFGQRFTGLVINRRDLNVANPQSDPQLRPYTQRFLESIVSPQATTTSARVKELMEFLLPLGKCTMDHVARTLEVDRRTLHRRLAEEGESFSGLLHATRAGWAEHYLASGHSMTDIAHQLGFAAPSAYSRWFQQQFGMSPSQWRHTSTGRQDGKN